ncbi:MAG TPA: DUF2254 domain-containing protein [Bradyrhizobium sp.]|nr:DUF2254 domain-containing protein [Bradyrhizobium sp.]
MLWNQWYSLKSYVRSSLWIVPFIALLLYLVAIRLIYAIDTWIAWTPILPWGLSGTKTVLETIVTLTLTFMVFTFGSLLVAIQVASGQLTPRIIAATLLRDNTIRFIVGLFVFTLLFAAGALARLETAVPQGIAELAGLLGFASVAAFLFLIDYAARLLRPVSIVWLVGEEGRAVIESVYPDPAKDPDVSASPRRKLPPPDRTIVHRGSSAIVLAVNLKALVAEAQQRNVIIELMPHVGDFVATGDPLFRWYGSACSIDENRLRGLVAFGPERTIEQDSTFAFRIIVDIAIKALSKAINDPTTAVLAIDQLQRLLRVVGNRHLLDEEILDATGQLRVIFRTPNWEDFVQLTFSEIRLYGAENFQIARRLRAMIESLTQTLPAQRHPALRTEMGLLDRMLEKLYTFPEDLALARTPDPQGLGGSSGPQAAIVRASTGA